MFLGMISVLVFIAFLVGVVYFAIKKNVKWKKCLAGAGAALVLLTTSALADSSIETTQQPSSKITQTDVAPATTEETNSPINYIKTTVNSVVDGDTIKVTISGKEESVRLIGVDNPETVKPNSPVEAYGKEASNFTKEQLTGKEVFLEKDVQERDKYGRLLAYVWLSPPTKIDDNEIRTKLFNAKLIIDGYGQLLTIPPNIKYVDYFTTYQNEAKENNVGLWAIQLENTQQPAQQQKSVSTPAASQPSLNESASAPTPAPQIYKQETTVYVTRTGSKYHVAGCRYLSKSQIPISLSDAKASYGPCSVCKPPQ